MSNYRKLSILAFSVLGFAASSNLVFATGQSPNLWTVQAVDLGGGDMACDAFAAGAEGRAPYEFRFRRSAAGLQLAISYDGPTIASPAKEATISVDKHDVATVPVEATHIGGKNAFAISLDPKSVDFSFFAKTVPLSATIGKEKFNIATVESDHVQQNFEKCLKFIHVD